MYDLDVKNPASDKLQWLTGQQLADLYLSFVESYPIVSIEDGLTRITGIPGYSSHRSSPKSKSWVMTNTKVSESYFK